MAEGTDSAVGGVEKPKRGDNNRPRNSRGVYVNKLTPEVIEDIDSAIRAGGSMETAAGFAGVAASTFRQWLVDGRRAEGTMGPHSEQIALKLELVLTVEEAIAGFKLSLTGGIFQHGRESWQAWAWLAERRFPDEFGRRQRIEHGNVEGESFRVATTPLFDPSKLTDEELEEAWRLLRKGQPDGGHPVVEQGQDLRLIEGGEGG